MEKVSIIIPTFNRKKCIRNAVKSALLQTYPEIEVIVVDDNSDYEITEVLKDFKDKITIIKNKKNMGVSAARNIGIKKSSGKYITFLDDDDLFHPKKIERQINIFNKEPNVGLVYCPAARKIDNVLIYKPLKKENNYWIRLTYQNRIMITPLIKRKCFSICGVFDTNLSCHEERDLMYRIGKKFSFGFDNYPGYIMYNIDIHRLSFQIENICTATKALYEKHKNDFKDKNSYYSDLNFELANAYLSFGNYRKYFQHFKISIEKNPNILKRYFKIYSKIPLYKAKFGYFKIKLDKKCFLFDKQ